MRQLTLAKRERLARSDTLLAAQADLQAPQEARTTRTYRHCGMSGR